MSAVFFFKATPSTPLGLRSSKDLESASYALDSARSPQLQEPRVCKLRPRLRSVSAVPRISSLQATPSTPLGLRSHKNLEQSVAPTSNKAKRKPATFQPVTFLTLNPQLFFYPWKSKENNYICGWIFILLLRYHSFHSRIMLNVYSLHASLIADIQ
jgi:hypothetical protein